MRHLIRLVMVRHASGAPWRSLLTIVGTALAVAGMVAITAANRAVLASYDHSMEQLSGRVDLQVGSGDAPVDENLLAPLSEVRGVAHIAAVVEAKARALDSGTSLLILGIDFTGDDYFRSFKASQSRVDPLEFLNCTNCLLISEKFAAQNDVKTGDDMRLMTPQGIRVFRVKDVLKSAGAAEAYGGNIGIMYLDAAQQLFERNSRYDRIDLAFAANVDREVVRAAVRGVVGEGVPVEQPNTRAERTQTSMQRFRIGLQVVSILALLVSMLMIYNTIGIAVAQRRREIGMLRALGVLRSEIRNLFVAEAVLLAVVGSALGLALGAALAKGVLTGIGRAVNNLYVDVNVSAATVEPNVALLAVGLCLATTALSAYLPARDAASTAPAVAMHRAASVQVPTIPWKAGLYLALGAYVLTAMFACLDWPRPRSWPEWPGTMAMITSLVAAAALVPAAILLTANLLRHPMQRFLGVPGLLAADNLKREGSRAVVTVSALMVGLALAQGAATFIRGFERSVGDWIAQAVPADLFLTGSAPLSQGAVRLPGRLREPLSALPYKYRMEPVTVRKTTFDDARISILSADLSVRLRRAHFKALTGSFPSPDAISDERIIFVSDNLAYRTKITAGDTMTLDTPTGKQAYRVAATYTDYTSDSGTVFMDRKNYTRDFKDDTVDSFEFYLDDPTQVSALRDAIDKQFGGTYDLFMITNGQLREQAQNIVHDTFRVTSAMSILAVIVALLGVVNTLIGAVVDRTRELGVLRAVGTLRGQVVKMFVYEAVLMALCAGTLGTAAGGLLGMLFVDVVAVQGTGWHIGFHPPWGYQALVVLTALLAAGAAALGPAWRGARRAITDSLAYE